MPKNIVIFSDGTGQAGGLRPDQNLSNVYKLFRATRTGPESPIDPKEQMAFYDAGLGTENDEGKIPFRPVQMFRKIWSAATGTGISRNIADCYEAILKHYEPGDRIFLIGFSRGAYTARCVGGVMSLCGIPTQAPDGRPLPRFGKKLRRIADEAVSEIYEHGSGSDNPERKNERLEKARRFRAKYGSADGNGEANEVPYFIGVFDTVAALGARGLRRFFMLLFLAVFVFAITAGIAGVFAALPWFKFWPAFAISSCATLIVLAVGYLKTSIKTIRDYPKPGNFRMHRAAWRFRFYDNSLNKRVRFARHAIAIDETRKDFAREPWANAGDWMAKPGEPEWLRQVWFAGNHSDVGGSYPEDESRLSDISLQWMVEQALELPDPLVIDPSRLRIFPDPSAMQHSEIESMNDSYPWLRRLIAEKIREMRVDAPLHATVIRRLSLPSVPHYGVHQPYRPQNLSKHIKAQHFFAVEAPPVPHPPS